MCTFVTWSHAPSPKWNGIGRHTAKGHQHAERHDLYAGSDQRLGRGAACSVVDAPLIVVDALLIVVDALLIVV